MKKIMYFMLLTIVLALVGCSIGNSNQEDKKTEEESKSKIKVTFVIDYYWDYDEEKYVKISSESEKVYEGLLEEPDEPTRDGYLFQYWATYNAKKDKFVEWDFDDDEASDDIILYAQWIAGCTVNFIVDGEIYSKKTVEENSVVRAAKTPKKDGYEFLGWYLEDELFDFNTKITGNINLVAKYKNLSAQTYMLGMGIVVNTNSSYSASEYSNGLAQVDATFAAVVLDEEGKIVMCRLDAVLNKASVSSEGEVTIPATFRTKVEWGDDYNMARYGQSMDWNQDGVVKEWYEQAQAFEAHVVGMTAADVKAMKTQVVEGAGYVISADEALLAAGCTIQITDFKEAVYKACTDAQASYFETAEEFTLGIAASSFDDGSANATADAAGSVKVYSDFAASVVVDGKIAASLNDAIQPIFTVSENGELTASFKATKRELKEDYNMSKYGSTMDPNGDGIVLEWYLQSAAFSQHVVGMTGAEVAAMETATNSIGYQMSTDADLLAAGCTIQITDIKAIVAKAAANER